jgi:hypothetical protein
MCGFLMRVAVMMRVLVAARHLFGRNHAALMHVAADVLELDGGVADVKMIAQQMVEFFEDAHAF